MKKLFLFAMMFASVSIFAQNDNNDKNKNKASNKLSAFELQVTRGGFFPDLSLNFYLKERTILKVSALKAGFVNFGDASNNSAAEMRTFLEFRKPVRQGKVFISHGPEVGYAYKNGEFDNHTFRVGYNIGAGYQINRHFTAGSYINPYISVNESGVDFLHGRLFSGALSNIYLAYRF